MHARISEPFLMFQYSAGLREDKISNSVILDLDLSPEGVRSYELVGVCENPAKLQTKKSYM